MPLPLIPLRSELRGSWNLLANLDPEINTRKAKWSEFCSHFKNALLGRDIMATPKIITDGADLENISQAYTDAIHKACTNIIPSVGVRKSKAVPPWWTQNLKVLKEEVLRKKRRIRNAAPITRQHVMDEYLQVQKSIP
ncbi:hypothetical protein EVAR_34603_1 [Eumeta japonica]|uniref:Uncharacterized protein n=1 Tax=Eumeta variegata TaxID=151549 RepID=A0A4C1VEL6_EUMVA|nr:hypothetical protein EVAR_34603_1 [Eumeta japonica]